MASLAVEKKRRRLSLAGKGLPRYDLAEARYVLGVGADFLAGWASPVYYARQFGHFRQGRPGLRGKLVQAESRMSLTAATADEWLPVAPGAEPHLLVAIARMLLEEKLSRNADSSLAAVIDAISSANLAELIRASGISEKRLRRIVRELGESERPPVIAGASIVQSNSLEAVVAAHYLNLLLGNVGKSGGLIPPALELTPPNPV